MTELSFKTWITAYDEYDFGLLKNFVESDNYFPDSNDYTDIGEYLEERGVSDDLLDIFGFAYGAYERDRMDYI
jgi:uncharacterized protein YozE (UPF0346 family)